VQLKQFTLRRGRTIRTKKVLATAGICCTTSLPRLPAMEASSIVQVQQLQILYRRRCPHHNLQRMFGTSWTERIVVAREPRRQDGGRWLGTIVKCQTATDERASQPSRP